MILKNIICKECIKDETEAENIEEILMEISKLAKKNKALKKVPEKEIFDSLLKRENIGSTGFGNGIAIPHCSFDALDDFVVGIVVSKKGIKFKALDGKKVNIFFFIIGSSKKRNKHIQILSLISRLLKSNDIVDRIIKASSNEELFTIISENTEINEESIVQKEKVLFHVLIQKEKYFNDILEILSEVVEGSISVIETVNAGHFLHALPLFSSFWSDDKKTYNRIIVAIVDKNYSNNVIRKINTTVDNIEKESGVLIAVNELFYTNGHIDF